MCLGFLKDVAVVCRMSMSSVIDAVEFPVCATKSTSLGTLPDNTQDTGCDKTQQALPVFLTKVSIKPGFVRLDFGVMHTNGRKYFKLLTVIILNVM